MSKWGYLRYRKDMGPYEQVGDENPNIDLLVSTSWMERVSIDYEAAAIAMLGLLQNENVSSRQLVYGTVDAALGVSDG